ncbi:AraC family transcriptional regulator [Saccharopolyspora sp. ID03-671]|uniref:AraC family transcriptional regulator n=1 Tax=Saccharopolyspora sp. ID03-671 TaxID=3073066 RepID=UPI003250B01A
MVLTGAGAEPLRNHPVLRSRDLDEVQELGERLFAPHRLELSDRAGALDALVNAVGIQDVTIGYVRYGPPVRITVADMSDTYQINIPVTGAMKISDGRDTIIAGPRRPAVMVPGARYVGQWTLGCTQLAVNITRAALDDELARLLGRPISGPIRFDLGMDLAESAVQSWFSAVRLAVAEIDRSRSVLLDPRTAGHLERILITGLLLSARHDHSAALAEPHPQPGPSTVRRAVEIIEARAGEPLSVTDVAEAVGVSVRSLQEGFRAHVGVSPMAYLRDVRLVGAHRCLSQASPETTTVTDVACRWGFTHLGRFAAAYQRKYGVAPSRTLRADGSARNR